jgi:hypothetical protein
MTEPCDPDESTRSRGESLRSSFEPSEPLPPREPITKVRGEVVGNLRRPQPTPAPEPDRTFTRGEAFDSIGAVNPPVAATALTVLGAIAQRQALASPTV